MLITVFTATYNRGYLLKNLYESLLMQNFNDFEWLVVDDGSTDNTEHIINECIRERKLQIRYLKKPNGGKHTAINAGVQLAKGELFFIIDSDDILIPHALAKIETHYKHIRDNPTICGIAGLCDFIQSHKIVGDKFPREKWVVSLTDMYFKYKISGDKALIFKTEILKKYRFPEPAGIKMVFEAVVWHEMAKKFKVICFNDVLRSIEYRHDGLSASSYKLWYIHSLAYSFFCLIKNKTYPLFKHPKMFFQCYVILGIHSLLSGKNYFRKLSCMDKIIFILLFPRMYYSYLRMRDKIISE